MKLDEFQTKYTQNWTEIWNDIFSVLNEELLPYSKIAWIGICTPSFNDGEPCEPRWVDRWKLTDYQKAVFTTINRENNYIKQNEHTDCIEIVKTIIEQPHPDFQTSFNLYCNKINQNEEAIKKILAPIANVLMTDGTNHLHFFYYDDNIKSFKVILLPYDLEYI